MSDIEKRFQELIKTYKNKDFKVLLKKAIKFTSDYPQNYNGWVILGVTYRALRNNFKAIEIYKDIIHKFPNQSAAYNNLGNTYLDIGNVEESIKFYSKSIEIDNNDCNPYDGLGLAYTSQGNLEKANEYFKKAIKINPSFERAQFNLADNYRKRNMYKEAIGHYEKANFKLSRSHKLECHYYLNEKDEFFSELKTISKLESLNSLAACLSAHASERYEIEDIYPFCRDPLDHVFIDSLFEETDFDENYITDLLKYIKENRPDFMSQSLLKNGKQSAGNLFLRDDVIINKIKKIINKKISDYRNKFKNSNEGIFVRWPKSYILYGWIIEMTNQGNLNSHIHKEGWISGSIYLSLPSKTNNNEGKLKVGLHGAGYPTDNKNFRDQVLPIKGS